MFGGRLEAITLPWAWANERLDRARRYWIATTRPDGRPHCRPVWGVWVDDAVCFSTGSAAITNLLARPDISVQVDEDGEVVIIEGTATPIEDRPLTERIVLAYNAKYRWDLDVNALPGPFLRVSPRVVFGWVSDDSGLDGGAHFHGSVTRWRFD